MKISQKFTTPKGEVTINRTYKICDRTGVKTISETFVEAPFEDRGILNKFHRWAASVRWDNRLLYPPEEILDLVGGSWEGLA